MKVFLKENFEEVLFHGICKSSNVPDSPDADASPNANADADVDANPNAAIGTAEAPMMQSPVHNDIHLHASYQQTSYVFPKPVAVHHPVAKVSSYNSVGSILVLFILLVIITRGICKY